MSTTVTAATSSLSSIQSLLCQNLVPVGIEYESEGWITKASQDAIRHFTDWISDQGTIRRLEVQMQRPNIIGNTQWFKGRAKSKVRSKDETSVDLHLWAENQCAETTTASSATVVLPTKT